MKKLLCTAFFTALLLYGNAQRTKVMSFPITDYIINAGDSVTIVQIQLPKGLSIKDKAYCLIKPVIGITADTAFTVGNGKCYLIKGDYYYFGLFKKSLLRTPVAGDLLYADVMAPAAYEGVLFDAIKHSITLNNVFDSALVNLNAVLQISNEQGEKPYLERLAADIKFTGAEMIKQGAITNEPITKGKFSGQKILNAMQAVSIEDVKDFLRYIYARPEKYAGHTWKISETMATWMVAGAPTVKE